MAREGIEFRRETVTGIDPHRRWVATDHGSNDADLLAIALGAEYDTVPPGIEEAGYE
jgi:sulfide:quinone oxidoreductase